MANWQLHFRISNKIKLTSDLGITTIAILVVHCALFVSVKTVKNSIFNLHVSSWQQKPRKLIDIQKPLHSLLKIDVGIVMDVPRGVLFS